MSIFIVERIFFSSNRFFIMIDFQDSQLNNYCIVTYYFLYKSILQMHSVYKISKLDIWTPGHASQLRSYLTRYLQIFSPCPYSRNKHHYLLIFFWLLGFFSFGNPFIDFFIHLLIPFFNPSFHISSRNVSKISTRFNYEKIINRFMLKILTRSSRH